MLEQGMKELLSYGVLGIIVIITIYGISKLYKDMQDQHNKQIELSIKREDELIKYQNGMKEYLDKKNISDEKIVNTLDNINDKMECMDKRIEYIEKKLPHDV